jgi:hypothetical protein
MTCRPIYAGGRVIGIACTRGRTPTIACDEPHCARPHTRLCDYPVTRQGRTDTCSRRLCTGHAVRVGSDRDYCQAHARAADPEPDDLDL